MPQGTHISQRLASMGSSNPLKTPSSGVAPEIPAQTRSTTITVIAAATDPGKGCFSQSQKLFNHLVEMPPCPSVFLPFPKPDLGMKSAHRLGHQSGGPEPTSLLFRAVGFWINYRRPRTKATKPPFKPPSIILAALAAWSPHPPLPPPLILLDKIEAVAADLLGLDADSLLLGL